MIKYIYPDRVTTELKTFIQRSNIPIIYNNVSTCAHALMTFYESNLVPAQSSKKWLKLQFNANSIPEKRNSTQDIPQLIRKANEIKIVTFNNVEDQQNYHQRLDDFGTPPNYSPTTSHYQPKESKANGRDNYVNPTSKEDSYYIIQREINNQHHHLTRLTNQLPNNNQ